MRKPKKPTPPKASPAAAVPPSPGAAVAPAPGDATKNAAKIRALSAEWAKAKLVEEAGNEGKREAERLKAEILALGAKIGYEDADLIIRGADVLDGVATVQVLDDERLLQVLKAESALEDSFERRPARARVEALAELNPKIARVLATMTGQAPRFMQAAKQRDRSSS